MMRSRVLVTLVFLPLSACPDDDPGAGDTADTSADTQADTAADSADTGADTGPVSQPVDDRFAAAYCSLIETCYADYDTSENYIAMLLREASDEQCKAWIRRLLLDPMGRDAGIAAGAYSVDEAKLSACLTSLNDSCSIEPIGACQEVIEGKVAAGGDCKSSDDCAGDAYCWDPDGCGGRCAARVGAGEDCDESDACSNSAGRMACSFESQTCVPVDTAGDAPLDAACGEVHSATRVTLTRCATGLACEADVCQAIVPEGGACINDHTPCARGTLCLPDAGGSRTCRTIQVGDSAGDTCNEAFQPGSPLIVCNPVLFLGCKEGQCAQAGDGSAGSTCFTNQDPDLKCDAGLYCDGAAYQCTAAKADGAECDSDEACASGYCDVSGDPGTCAPAPACP